MNNEILKEWSTRLNIPMDKIQKDFENALVEMKSYFPTQSTELLEVKALQKIKLDNKRKMLSNAVPFIGIMIAEENARDPFSRIRAEQLEKYDSAKAESVRIGDQTIVQSALDNKIVRIDETGTVIPLWPKLKTNGQPSKVAGQDMPSLEESMTKTVYGISTPVGKETVKTTILEMKDKACGSVIPKGKVVSFRAYNKTQPGDVGYMLSAYDTEFVNEDDEYFKEGLDKVGLPQMILGSFRDNVVTWEQINTWAKEKKEKLASDPIPERYKRGITILPESMCVYQNLNPDSKGRIKINLCGMSDETDAESITVLCLGDKSLEKDIDFAQNSKVVAVGRLWIPTPREDQGITVFFMISGIFAYPDWKIPRVSAEKLTVKNIMAPTSVVSEAKPAESVKSSVQTTNAVPPGFDNVKQTSESQNPW